MPKEIERKKHRSVAVRDETYEAFKAVCIGHKLKPSEVFDGLLKDWTKKEAKAAIENMIKYVG